MKSKSKLFRSNFKISHIILLNNYFLLKSKVREVCTDCKGSGLKKKIKKRQCDVCDNKRQTFFNFSPILIRVDCLDCQNSKSKDSFKCSCNKGITTNETEVEVELKGHCTDGMIVSIPHLGHINEIEGAPGNLNVRIEIDPIPPGYEIENDFDLRIKKEISPVQAVIGGEVSVETPNGVFQFRIPSHLNQFSEASVRYVGYGLLKPWSGVQNYGDLILDFSVRIPENLSFEQKKLYVMLDGIEKNESDLEKYVNQIFDNQNYSKTGVKSTGNRKQDLAALWGK